MTDIHGVRPAVTAYVHAFLTLVVFGQRINLESALGAQGRFDEAMAEFREAARLAAALSITGK